jgi:hypothetical protein
LKLAPSQSGRGTKKRKKRYGSDFSEDDSEEYVPRVSKRRASATATKKFKDYDDSDESSEENFSLIQSKRDYLAKKKDSPPPRGKEGIEVHKQCSIISLNHHNI